MGKLSENKSGSEALGTKKQRDKEFDQWVRKRFLEEAEDIERELDDIPKHEDWEPSEEDFQKLLKEARDRGLIGTLGSSEKTKDDRYKKRESFHENEKDHAEFEKGRFVLYGWKRRAVKWTAIAAATVVGVFGVSMSSEANRAYVMEEVNKIFGNDVNTKVNNDEVLESDRTEDEARGEIEEKLNVQIPDFYYFPEKLEYQKYTIDDNAESAIMQYKYEEQIVYFLIFVNDKTMSRVSQKSAGEKIETIASELSLETVVNLWELQEQGDEEPTYTLEWIHKNNYYEFIGKLPKEEMERMAREIMY